MLARRPERTAEASWDQKEMTFTEHLRELRKRLLISVITVVVLALALFWPSQYAIPWLIRLYFRGITLHAFGPADVILVEFKFSLYAAIVLGLPVLIYQLWMFIVPAFAPRTRRMVYAFIVPSVLLAAAGVAFCHYVVLPRVIHTLIAVTMQVAQPTFGVAATLNLVLLLFLAFALVFQTPMVLIMLARVGIVSAPSLRRYRRYAIVGMLLGGAIAAPDGNPITMLMLALPMYVLYEVSIMVIALLEKSWQAESARP